MLVHDNSPEKSLLKLSADPKFNTTAGDMKMWVRSLGQEDPLKGMATHSSIHAYRIPQTEEPGELQFRGLQGLA